MPSAVTIHSHLSLRSILTTPPHPPLKMLSRQIAARFPATVARRGFHSTRPQFASPYHYPEGPRSNIPFNPLTRFFAVRYWLFMATGFFAPFGIAVWQTKKNQ